MIKKLLRTIRFDMSDDHVYADAAASDEWAVSGAFAFVDLEAGALVGKTKQAFANGFLGIESFGRSTFATVGEIEPAEETRITERLAAHFVERYGAPDLKAATPAARAEIEFIAGLVADAPLNTVFTVRRIRNDTGDVREEFRTIKPPAGEPQHARIWTIEHDDA